MANGTATAPGLSFPRETFAKLTPGPFLQAHLKQPFNIRPNGRKPEEFRKPTINTGSLTHSNGSAVVRVGDTAVVCGVRGEILLASDIPHPPGEDIENDDIIEEIGLLVPNLELSTGCSPVHLPGNPPSALAQTLSYRISALLHTSHLLNVDDLQILYTEPAAEDGDLTDGQPKTVVKAYWTLYIDILCIALDGNVIDAAWGAVVAALQATVLPKACWDPDTEMIVCSPLAADARKLQIKSLPIISSFAFFSTSSPIRKADEAEDWILADPDAFEESVCRETLAVTLSSEPSGEVRILRLEKSGGPGIGREMMEKCVRLSAERCSQWKVALGIV
ncbi:hypothetical protein M433DRAFT_386769 [Acidomyces richmondensis BFW]|nr:MAG: hypothetical protein FE78DRAFT_66072 [Acidomyces sp. 'richmondensis']KYG48792.1 hypothetical protein M433DRAFT_386769 [Acidomyces richmondensis BFW]